MIKLSSRPVSFYALAMIASFVGFLRALFEHMFFGAPITIQILWFMPYFYFSIGIILFALFRSIVGIDWRRSFGAVAMGVMIGIFPPCIDLVHSGFQSKIRYSYNFFAEIQNYPWCFFSGPDGLPMGESISVWLSISFATIYAFLSSRSLLRSVFLGCILFVVFHLYMSWIPIITATSVLGELPDPLMTKNASGHVINAVTYFFPFWYIGISLGAYFVLRPRLLLKLVDRVLHILPFALISVFGAFISGQSRVESILNAICISIIFYIAAIENDYYDQFFEKNPNGSDINRHDISFYRIIIVLIISWLLLMGHLIAIMYLLIYFAAAIYHMPNYRARKYFAAGMKIEGAWGWLAYISGTLLTTTKLQDIQTVLFGVFIFFGWSLISVLKDLKDLRPDRRAGNESLYLFLRRKGISLGVSHHIISGIIFIGLMLPALLLFSNRQWLGGGYLVGMGLGLLIVLHTRWFRRFKIQLFIICLYLGGLIYYVDYLNFMTYSPFH